MEGELKLSPETGAEMERHLTAVADALRRSGTAERDVQSVLQDLRNQIIEMLSSRGLIAPTVQDVQEVLGGVAPPETYAEGPGPQSAASSNHQRVPSSEINKVLCVAVGVALGLAGLFIAVFSAQAGVGCVIVVAGCLFCLGAYKPRAVLPVLIIMALAFSFAILRSILSLKAEANRIERATITRQSSPDQGAPPVRSGRSPARSDEGRQKTGTAHPE